MCSPAGPAFAIVLGERREESRPQCKCRHGLSTVPLHCLLPLLLQVRAAQSEVHARGPWVGSAASSLCRRGPRPAAPTRRPGCGCVLLAVIKLAASPAVGCLVGLGHGCDVASCDLLACGLRCPVQQGQLTLAPTCYTPSALPHLRHTQDGMGGGRLALLLMRNMAQASWALCAWRFAAILCVRLCKMSSTLPRRAAALSRPGLEHWTCRQRAYGRCSRCSAQLDQHHFPGLL